MLAGLGLVTAVLSMWVSNTATTAMMLPIALGILGALHRDPRRAGWQRRRWTRGLAVRDRHDADGRLRRVDRRHRHAGRLAAEPDRHRPASAEHAGVDITFFTWMAVAVPMLVVMAAVLFVLLYRLHPEHADGRGRPSRQRG